MTMPSWVRLLIMDGILLAVFLMSPCAAAPAHEPSPSPSCCCCSRSLFTTLWGFVFALGGLTLDAWHTADTHNQRAASFRTKLYYAVFYGPVAPFSNLLALYYDVYAYVVLSVSLNNMPDGPQEEAKKAAKKAAKIIANCKVVLGTSEGRLPPTHGTALPDDFTSPVPALVLGSKLPENSHMVQLNYKGKEALLRSGVLPHYRRLQLLQGNRSFAMVLNGMQAFGYVLAVLVRVEMGLLVSPIETIGFTFSILVVMHSVCHFVAAPCHCPLIVYLHPDQEQDNVFRKCRSTQWSKALFTLASVLSFLVSSVVGSYILTQPSRRSPETPPVNCITAEDSSRGLSLIPAGRLMFICSANFHLFTNLWTGSRFSNQDQRRIRDPAPGLPREEDMSLADCVHDFVEHIRGVNVVRQAIWIRILDCIHPAGTVFGMIIALVTTIVYRDENFAERTTGIEYIWPFIG